MNSQLASKLQRNPKQDKCIDQEPLLTSLVHTFSQHAKFKAISCHLMPVDMKEVPTTNPKHLKHRINSIRLQFASLSKSFSHEPETPSATVRDKISTKIQEEKRIKPGCHKSAIQRLEYWSDEGERENDISDYAKHTTAVEQRFSERRKALLKPIRRRSFECEVLRELHNDFDCSVSDDSWISYPPPAQIEENKHFQVKLAFLADKIKSKFQYCNLGKVAVAGPRKEPKPLRPSRQTQNDKVIEKDPFASDNDYSECSSILSHYDVVPTIFDQVLKEFSYESEQSEPEPQPAQSESSVSDPPQESLYRSIDSGLQEQINDEVSRLKDLSMEVIPLEPIENPSQQSASQSPIQGTTGPSFRIRKTNKRLTQLERAYHPQDTALVQLHQPIVRLTVDQKTKKQVVSHKLPVNIQIAEENSFVDTAIKSELRQTQPSEQFGQHDMTRSYLAPIQSLKSDAITMLNFPLDAVDSNSEVTERKGNNTVQQRQRRQFDVYEHGELFGFRRPMTPVKPPERKLPTPFQNLGPDLPVFKCSYKKKQRAGTAYGRRPASQAKYQKLKQIQNLYKCSVNEMRRATQTQHRLQYNETAASLTQLSHIKRIPRKGNTMSNFSLTRNHQQQCKTPMAVELRSMLQKSEHLAIKQTSAQMMGPIADLRIRNATTLK